MNKGRAMPLWQAVRPFQASGCCARRQNAPEDAASLSLHSGEAGALSQLALAKGRLAQLLPSWNDCLTCIFTMPFHQKNILVGADKIRSSESL